MRESVTAAPGETLTCMRYEYAGRARLEDRTCR